MILFSRNIFIFLMIAFCTSCASREYNAELNLTKLYDANTKLGLLIARPMYFKSTEEAEDFCTTGFSNILNVDYSLSLDANNQSSISFSVGRSLRDKVVVEAGVNNADPEFIMKYAHLIHKPVRRGGFFELSGVEEKAIVKPEYFYTVSMVPEGLYSISKIHCFDCGGDFYGSSLEKNFGKEEQKYYFYVKAGHINYIGDFFWVQPKLTRGYIPFMANEYAIQTKHCNRAQDAKNFLKRFFPKIKLPFTESMVQKK